MSLAEGVQGVIYYKAYSSGAIVSNVEDLSPGASGAQTLRRVSSTLNLKKNTYTSAEIRPDRQIFDFRHGARHVDGDIAGELSPGTYFDFFEAVHRDTRAAGANASQSDFTSLAASASALAFTLGSGDPVAKGFLIGDPVRFTGNTASANDGKNFFITSFSGTSNETVHVTPAPVDSSASTTFTMIAPGKHTIVPASGFVSRKFGIEIHHQDLDQSRLFTEVRATKYALSLPATGMSTATFSFMGRDMVDLSGGAAPYFSSNPAAVTTSGIFAAVNGTLLLSGTQVGVVTGITLQCDLAPTAADVVGQNVPAEIFLSRANVTGSISAYLQDTTLFGDFLNETELELMVQLNATSAANSPVNVIYLPRIKLGGADLSLTGESGQTITAPFQALRYIGATPGKANTTIRICDTEV